MSGSMDKHETEHFSLSGSEKIPADISIDEVNDQDVDEALKLVGLERTSAYTEAQYNRVKRRLVRNISLCVSPVV